MFVVARLHRHARARFGVAVAAALLSAGSLRAQATTATTATSAAAAQGGVNLQGIWDFNMRVGERTSPGFLALGPLEDGWAGSITMYLTNTLAIRRFTVVGDSLQMVVASREGDVTFRARLSDDGRTMRGIVEYHGGARLPMVAMRRAEPVAPR